MPDSLDLGFSVFENATFFRNILEPTQPGPPLIGETFPDFFWHTPPDPFSVQVVERSAFSSFTPPPGFSSFHSQLTTRPVYDVKRNWDPYYEGVTEAKSRLTGDVLPSAVVPVIPPVRFVSRALEHFLILSNTVGLNFPNQLDQDTAKKLQSRVKAVGLQAIGTYTLLHQGSSGNQPRRRAP